MERHSYVLYKMNNFYYAEGNGSKEIVVGIKADWLLQSYFPLVDDRQLSGRFNLTSADQTISD